MKVVFDEQFRELYYHDPAAAKGRLDAVAQELARHYEFVKPTPATVEDILLCHTPGLVQRISYKGRLYEMALLAAGATIKAAQIAMSGEPAFALARPPGHHASSDSCWGFCWFNNVAIAVEKMRREAGAEKVLIIDIDWHFGDGTANIFADNPAVDCYNLRSLDDMKKYLHGITHCDLIAISAGFDGHVEDWGGFFLTEDYFQAGHMVSKLAARLCKNRIFAALEGGYNHDILGHSARALLAGLEGKAAPD